jgi:hypothetical protein
MRVLEGATVINDPAVTAALDPMRQEMERPWGRPEAFPKGAFTDAAGDLNSLVWHSGNIVVANRKIIVLTDFRMGDSCGCVRWRPPGSAAFAGRKDSLGA